MTTLVIVESPAKAKTIGRFLGPDYDVEASIGHIRDLPQPSKLPDEMKKGPFGKFAVDTTNGFEPYYVVDAGKKKTVADLKRRMKDADELLLATDEDREGEAIAWHLLQTLKPKIPTKRIVFHEITKEAISRALENPREVDLQLVDAQETRRILDRLYGYEVSPVLWRKIKSNLSAGRVQSVATRLVVERERERMAFVSASYWSVEAHLHSGEETFTAKLTGLDSNPIAKGADFADDGDLTPAAIRKNVVTLGEESATAVAAALESSTVAVTSVESKPSKRRPAPPFTTSTLQQEASRKLGMNSRQTMSQAQQLYENGFITYMRTDSVELSSQAINAARSQIQERYGEGYVPDKPRFYTKKAKGAQEAHEAIRPAGDHFRTPDQVKSKLSGAQFKLYELIWKRTLASQMADANLLTVSAKFSAGLANCGFSKAELSASGTVVTFPGYLAVYEEGRDKARYEEKDDARLPELTEGDVVDVVDPGAEASGHETTPPPRYTDASLVRKLEELGIGRPSTYAATISVITERGYVDYKGQALVPTWLAFSVVRLLEENLPSYVDYDFTAQLESSLDAIATGEGDRVAYLEAFYHGDDSHPGLAHEVENIGDIDPRELNTNVIGEGISVRVGKYGPYLEKIDDKGESSTAPIPAGLAPDELDLAKAKELFESNINDGRVLGVDPATGHEVVAKNGRFGPYVTETLPEDAPKSAKPRTSSLLRSMSLETLTLEDGLKLLSIPREVGEDDGEMITALNGRFGPYLSKGKETRSLETEDQLFTITLEEAKALFAAPKQRRGRTAAGPIREFGTDPVSGKPVVLKDGRFGPYVTDGEVNASVPRAEDPKEIKAERAFELLVIRREKIKNNPPKKRKTAAKKTTTRKTTKKAPAKKAPAKKSTKSS